MSKLERAPRNSAIQTVGPAIHRQLKMRIFHELDTVVWEVDGQQLKLNYMDALRISTELRMQAKQAKKWAGDSRKQIDVATILTDAEENDKRNW